MTIEVRLIKWRDARRVCAAHHYLGAPQGHKFSLGIFEGKQLLGVMIWSRPVNRHLDNGDTLEMTRMCLMVRQKNLASQALAKAIKWISRYHEERLLISYSDAAHRGVIYAAAGWTPTPVAGGGKWRSGRLRRATVRWEITVNLKTGGT